MQATTYAVEARRAEGAPWMPVTTVQEDLVDFVAEQLIDLTEGGGSTEWRLRPTDPEVHHPKSTAAPREAAKITAWDRIRWWGMMRFSRRAR